MNQLVFKVTLRYPQLIKMHVKKHISILLKSSNDQTRYSINSNSSKLSGNTRLTKKMENSFNISPSQLYTSLSTGFTSSQAVSRFILSDILHQVMRTSLVWIFSWPVIYTPKMAILKTPQQISQPSTELCAGTKPSRVHVWRMLSDTGFVFWVVLRGAES